MSLLPSGKLSVEMGVYLTQGDPEQTPVVLAYLPVPTSVLFTDLLILLFR